ncbi:2-dehydropantoate 2-reductase [Sphingomonas sp. MG17]|uniref:2-dehydropantoate 2-reductase n=1 Tax=Sphingomonas tagetis TaxID=2949092 RepID=A0A9X2KQ41_9SPHN|nr:2-dehydropantoate 2-reductase [Sphingomonas tagetis]MCP3731353.1 2-dehydropantoate 2-reductase [Sphingomonas tagetis]
MTVAVIGAGAVGGVAAAALAGSSGEVTLCVRRPIPHLIVELQGDVREVPARIVADPAAVAVVDWVLLATKAQDTASAAPWLDRLVGPKTVVVVLQNGIGHADRVGPLLRQGQVLPAVVYSPGEVVAPGHVRSGGAPRYIVPAGPAGAAFARLFEGSVLKVEQAADFETLSWRKFLGNLCVNPITALTMRRFGIMRDPEIRSFARAILTEAVAVGRAAGAKLEAAEIGPLLDSFAAQDSETGSSMLFDRLAGRSMEHEQLTGVLVGLASRFGIEVPFNRAVLALLRGLQDSLARETG